MQGRTRHGLCRRRPNIEVAQRLYAKIKGWQNIFIAVFDVYIGRAQETRRIFFGIYISNPGICPNRHTGDVVLKVQLPV